MGLLLLMEWQTTAWQVSGKKIMIKALFRYLELFVDMLSFGWDLPPGGGGVLPYMGYIGMCRCEGYGFQEVYSRIGYINQSV